MFNLIKMDLYKMFKSKSFYVLNIILLVIALGLGMFMNFTLDMDYETAKDSNITYSNGDEISSTSVSSVTEEEYYEIQEDMKGKMDVEEFIIFVYSQGIINILLAIFIAIIVCSELESGFIKNIIPLKSSRSNLIISKNIIAIIFIVVQSAIAFLASIITTLIISGRINILDFNSLSMYLGLQILLRIAFASLIILISYLFKSKAMTMSFGIILATNIHGIVLRLIDKTINNPKFDLVDFSIINNTGMAEFTPDDYKKVIIISIVYFILYNIISTIRVRKMEIN